MNNTKKERDFSKATGISNMHTYNFTNPDNTSLVLKNGEWVNPCVPNYEKENKQVIKSIIQTNKEAVRTKEQVKEEQGKLTKTFDQIQNFRKERTFQNREVY